MILIRGRHMWEVQIGRIWVAIRRPSLWRPNGFGFVRLVPKDG